MTAIEHALLRYQNAAQELTDAIRRTFPLGSIVRYSCCSNQTPFTATVQAYPRDLGSTALRVLGEHGTHFFVDALYCSIVPAVEVTK